MVNRKRKVRKNLYLSDEELKLADMVKRGLVRQTDRHLYMRGVASSAEDLLRATNDKLQSADRKAIKESLRRYNLDAKSKFRNVRCNRCGFKFQNATATTSPTQVLCPRCGHKVVIPAIPIPTKKLKELQGENRSRWTRGKPGKDDLNLLGAWFGNTGVPEALSEYAKRYFKISGPDWLLLAEKEKNSKIAQLLRERPELLEEYTRTGGVK